MCVCVCVYVCVCVCVCVCVWVCTRRCIRLNVSACALEFNGVHTYVRTYVRERHLLMFMYKVSCPSISCVHLCVHAHIDVCVQVCVYFDVYCVCNSVEYVWESLKNMLISHKYAHAYMLCSVCVWGVVSGTGKTAESANSSFASVNQ